MQRGLEGTTLLERAGATPEDVLVAGDAKDPAGHLKPDRGGGARA